MVIRSKQLEDREDKFRSRVNSWGLGALGLLAGVALWEFIGRDADGTTFASFTSMAERFVEMVADGSLPDALISTAAVYIVGLVAALAVGVSMGLLMARVRLLRIGLEDYLAALYATPMVALIPFILAILGFGYVPKVVVVFLFAVFPVLLNTVEGARSVSPELLDVARAYRSNERQQWLDIIIPYTLPYAMSGVRQSIARGLVGAIAAEFLLSSDGVGQLIILSTQRADAAGVLAAIVVVTLIGVALMGLGRALESKFAVWRVN